MQTYRFFRKNSEDPTKYDPDGVGGVWEDVEPVLWRWEAVYRDGTILKQYEDPLDPLIPHGTFHQLREIEQTNLHSFIMRNAETGKQIVMLFPEKAKLIHFYRNSIFNQGAEDEARVRVFCFGFELPHTKQMYMIMPDGNLVITDDVDKVTISTIGSS